MTTVDEVPKEGWGQPLMAKKFHYFVEGRSLCRRWGFWGDLTPDIGQRTAEPGYDDCTPCWRARNRMLAP